MDASLIVFLVGTLVGSGCGGGGRMLVRTILAPPDPRLMWTVIFWTSCDHWNTLESLGKACHLKGDYHHAEDDIGNKQQIESERYWRWYAGLACTILANKTCSSGIISVLPRSLSPWACRHFAICDGYRQPALTQRKLNRWNMPSKRTSKGNWMVGICPDVKTSETYSYTSISLQDSCFCWNSSSCKPYPFLSHLILHSQAKNPVLCPSRSLTRPERWRSIMSF